MTLKNLELAGRILPLALYRDANTFMLQDWISSRNSEEGPTYE